MTYYMTDYILQSIEDGSAVKISAACFRQGDEDEHHMDFYRLDGAVVRQHYNRRTTITQFYEVEGDDLGIFNHHYPEAA